MLGYPPIPPAGPLDSQNRHNDLAQTPPHAGQLRGLGQNNGNQLGISAPWAMLPSERIRPRGGNPALGPYRCIILAQGDEEQGSKKVVPTTARC